MCDANDTITLTPKGILYCALRDAGIEFAGNQLNKAWELFEDNMKRLNYMNEDVAKIM